jgi:hypothetical protein
LPQVIQLEEMYKEAMQDVFPQCLACKENKQTSLSFKTFNDAKVKQQIKVICSPMHLSFRTLLQWDLTNT